MENIMFGTCDPLADEADRQRRRAETLEKGGIFIDVYPTHMKLAISPEADEKLKKEADAKGISVEELIQESWQDHLRRRGWYDALASHGLP